MWKLNSLIFMSLVTNIAGFQAKNNTLWDYTSSPENVRNNHIELIKLYMNTSVDPCEDFYEYACGNWKNSNELHFRMKSVFDVLNENTQLVLKQLIEGLSEDENKQPMALFYKSCMNTSLISERGNEPAIDFLSKFDGWPMVDSKSSDENIDWLNLSANLAQYNQNYILKANIDLDFDDITQDTYVIYLTTSFPRSTYIFEEISNFNLEVGLNANILDEIRDFEESFRNACSDSYENIPIFTLEELLIEEPHIDWERYLSILLQKPVYSTQKVTAPVEELKAIGALLSKTSSRIIANYILYNVMADLVYEFVNVNTFYETSSTRDEYCATYIQNYFSKSLSKKFVDKYLNESANDRAKQMSEEIREAFSEFIGNIFWIDDTTKEIAKEKANSIKLNVGYTAKDFENDIDYPDFKSNEFFENAMKLSEYDVKTLWFVKPGETRDRSSSLVQYDLEAFYQKYENTSGHVYITAGMLQPPLFNSFIPNWSNYGGIGYIIGHELTHGFNTKYIKARDNEQDSEWWSGKSFKQYIIRTLCYNFQYDKYKSHDMDISVDGQKTLHENMADNGGLKFGYEAYKKWLNNHPESDEIEINPVLKLSGEQLYFVSFAQTHCYDDSEDEIKEYLRYNHHTPSRFRVMGTISNSFDFARAFQCPIGSVMNPPRKCRF